MRNCDICGTEMRKIPKFNQEIERFYSNWQCTNCGLEYPLADNEYEEIIPVAYHIPTDTTYVSVRGDDEIE